MHGVSLLEVRGLEGARTIAKNEVRLTHFSHDNEFFVFGTHLFGRGAATESRPYSCQKSSHAPASDAEFRTAQT